MIFTETQWAIAKQYRAWQFYYRWSRIASNIERNETKSLFFRLAVLILPVASSFSHTHPLIHFPTLAICCLALKYRPNKKKIRERELLNIQHCKKIKRKRVQNANTFLIWNKICFHWMFIRCYFVIPFKSENNTLHT